MLILKVFKIFYLGLPFIFGVQGFGIYLRFKSRVQGLKIP